MLSRIRVLCLFIILVHAIGAQNKLLLWSRKLPNSTGIMIADSVSNQRMYRVSAPYLEVFEPDKAKNNETAVLIIPGGSYARLAYESSGRSIAKWLNRDGITAFVLYYRLPQQKNVEISYLAPLLDAQRAMKMIRANAVRYGISKNSVGVLGTSAGGHLAAGLCTIADDWAACGDSLERFSAVPDFAILVSPVISMADSITHRESKNNLLGKQRDNRELTSLFSADCQIRATTPRTILIHAANDKAVSAMHSIAYFSALMKAGVTGSSLQIFPQGGHSINMDEQPGITQKWTDLVLSWINENTHNK